MSTSARHQSPAPAIRTAGSPGLITRLGVTINILVRAGDTSGAWSLLDYTMPPRFAGPPAHRHAGTTETFYCVGGEVELTLDGRTVQLRTGEAAIVPPGVTHAFANVGDRPATVLIQLTPGGFEGYFDELAVLARESEQWPPADPSAIPSILSRYDHLPPVPF